MQTQPALDLITTVARASVRIDGVDYPLRTTYELTLEQLQRIERDATRTAELLDRDPMTEEEGAELSSLLRRVCEYGLDAPAAVLDRLGDINMALVFKVLCEHIGPGVLRASALMSRLVSGTPPPAPPATRKTAPVVPRGNHSRPRRPAARRRKTRR